MGLEQKMISPVLFKTIQEGILLLIRIAVLRLFVFHTHFAYISTYLHSYLIRASALNGFFPC